MAAETETEVAFKAAAATLAGAQSSFAEAAARKEALSFRLQTEGVREGAAERVRAAIRGALGEADSAESDAHSSHYWLGEDFDKEWTMIVQWGMPVPKSGRGPISDPKIAASRFWLEIQLHPGSVAPYGKEKGREKLGTLRRLVHTVTRLIREEPGALESFQASYFENRSEEESHSGFGVTLTGKQDVSYPIDTYSRARMFGDLSKEPDWGSIAGRFESAMAKITREWMKRVRL